jgi:N4-gp56 family major capsid protein
MAKTAFSTSNALTKKAWEERLFRDMKKESYFSRFMGQGKDNLVQEKTNLAKGKGDNITFGIRMRLSGNGVTSNQQLEGNEEKLTTHSFNTSLEEYAHAVRDAGPLDRKRAMFSIDEESVDALKDWGSEKIDALQFAAILESATKNFYQTTATGVTATGTPATAKGALVAAESKLTMNMISFIKTNAKTGGNRSYIPLRPVKVMGKKYYVLLVHPDSLYDLKQNDSAFNQAMREAEIRGKENPLFTGATAIVDGVVIHEHENCTIGSDAGSGSNVPYSIGHFMGAQALVFAWGKRPVVVSKEFDYDREHGYAWDMICATDKPVFNSQDYGSLAVYLSRTNVSGV